MFIGHFALGFAAKRSAPGLSLAVLFAAAQLADVLWPVLVWLGLEQVRIDAGNTKFTPLDFVSYPYSHSLLFLIVWGAVFGAICASSGRDDKAVVVIAALVVSDWILDWITHRPDMPLYPGSSRLGLGLWNSIPATIAFETTLFAAGIWMYARATRARDRVGRHAFVSFVGFLFAIYVANIGVAPPSVGAVVMAGIAGTAVLLLWAWWFDRHRIATG